MLLIIIALIALTPVDMNIQTVCIDTTEFVWDVPDYPHYDINILVDTSEAVPDFIATKITWNRGIVLIKKDAQ